MRWEKNCYVDINWFEDDFVIIPENYGHKSVDWKNQRNPQLSFVDFKIGYKNKTVDIDEPRICIEWSGTEREQIRIAKKDFIVNMPIGKSKMRQYYCMISANPAE